MYILITVFKNQLAQLIQNIYLIFVVDLAITHAFPCRSRLSDKEMAPLVELEIRKAMESRRLTLVGWYHSHPSSAATPSLRDINSQLDYQIVMKGGTDASYTPCVGVICCEYLVTSRRGKMGVAVRAVNRARDFNAEVPLCDYKILNNKTNYNFLISVPTFLTQLSTNGSEPSRQKTPGLTASENNFLNKISCGVKIFNFDLV